VAVKETGRGLAALWRDAVAAPPVAVPFLVRGPDGWRPVGWDEAARAVDELAAGFLALGVGKGDRVAILSRTRLEWTLCDWALISIGAPVVPVYPTSSALECAFLLGNSGARFLVCEDEEQLAKVAPARSELEALELVIAIDRANAAGLPLEDVRARGRALLESDPSAVERACAAVGEDDLLTIIYTSGTTGPPKGCTLTHRNYRAMVEMIRRVEGLVERGDVAVLHLPLAHVFGRLVELVGPGIGITIAFCPDVAGVASALREVRPTIFASIPRLYAKVGAAVQAGFDDAGPARRRVIRWALDVGRRASRFRQDGRPLPRRLALRHVLAGRLVFSKVKDRLGGRLRVAISGGAPLPVEVAELFHALDIPLLEGYGLSEGTTVATVNRPARYRLGTVGQAVPGVELRIAADGEILLRGETVFAGYYRDEEATRAVLLADGWLATGDLGELDADGFLTVTGRKKDIIVTAAGENVSPQNIETALTASKYIADAVIVGDGRPYLVALLAPDAAEVASVATTDDEVRELLGRVVADVNRDRGPAEQVKRFAVLPRDLSLEQRELTPTLKVRRRICEEHFRDEIERLYAKV
jgi:long-chain acyl-CoA synthetase